MRYKLSYVFISLLCVLSSVSAHAMQQANITTVQSLSETEAEAQATYIQALQAFENEQYEQALKLMKLAYPQISKNSGVNFALADIYFQLGENTEAIQYARQAVKLDSENKWFHLKLADLYQATGQNSEAIHQLEAAHQRFPNDRDMLNKLAVAYANQGDLQKANEQYNRLLTLAGPTIGLRMQKLKIFSLLNMDDSLAVELDNILKLHPQQANTFKILSSYYRDLGNNQMAQKMLKEAGLNEPNDVNTLTKRAETYIASSKWDSLRSLGFTVMDDSLLTADQKLDFTRSIYEKYDDKNISLPAEIIRQIIHDFLQKEPDYIPAREFAVNFFIATGQLEKALEQLAKINASMPGNKDAWMQRLHLLMDRGNAEATLKTALKANEQLPQDAFVYYAVGGSYLAQHNYAKALEWLRKAADLPARSPLKYDMLQALGKTYMQLEQWQDAFNAYQKAFDYDESDPQAMEQMGDVLDKLNKPEEARRWWQKALRENPGNKKLQEKLSQ